MANQSTIYPFSLKTLNGQEKSLSDFKGKVLMIVNTASGCGLTPQLEALQSLRSEFKDDGFEVLGFPSNNFGKQEPLENAAIGEFCQVNFGVEFPMFEKIEVKGKNVHPLFKFLGSKKLNGKVNGLPLWDFHKYLVNAQGEVVDYFLPFTGPTANRVKKKIRQLLDETK